MSTARALYAVAASALFLGCGPDDYNPGPETCDRSIERNPPVKYTQGTIENGIYMTSSWEGEQQDGELGLLYFPGGMHYKLEHNLGEIPRFFAAYLSFDRYGTRDGGTIGLASGNQVELLSADATTMLVRNAECVDYWLIVVAGAGVPPSP
jgi:hypothetical protein